MSDPKNPISWVEKAEEDFELAEIALYRPKPLTTGSTFHAQQCAEKYMKGLLVLRGYTPPKIHDLVALYAMCLQHGFIVPVEEDELSLLTRYASWTRYPGEEPSHEQAHEALDIAKAVRAFARPILAP
jgi:HEPN domain-containing protein